VLACTWWFNSHGEAPNQLTLARQAGTDVKMTSQLLRTLEGKGLIDRDADPSDARAKRLRVTSRGADLAPRAIAAVEEADRQFFDPLSPDAMAILRRLAQRET
jgi:DNA-binding MarR family transcriptional regulator